MKNDELLISAERLSLLLKQSTTAVFELGKHEIFPVAMTEWGDGSHSHIGLEIMDGKGIWIPIFVLPMNVCRSESLRQELRQFPLFRLAWYGQSGEPNITPQNNVSEQDR